MRTTLLAAIVATGLGVAPAFADNASGYAYPNFWGDQAAQQEAPAAQAQAHGGFGTYVTQSSHGTWLFPPNPNQGANG
jgi:hypothetical protein